MNSIQYLAAGICQHDPDYKLSFLPEADHSCSCLTAASYYVPCTFSPSSDRAQCYRTRGSPRIASRLACDAQQILSWQRRRLICDPCRCAGRAAIQTTLLLRSTPRTPPLPHHRSGTRHPPPTTHPHHRLLPPRYRPRSLRRLSRA